LFTSGRESDGVLIGFENPDDISASLPLGVSRFFLGGGAGDNRLELLYRDGRLVKVCRHENLGAKALEERFA